MENLLGIQPYTFGPVYTEHELKMCQTKDSDLE